MPISENELMWARTLPEEVEAGAPEVVATGGPSATATESPARLADVEMRAETAEAEMAETEPDVRVQETSRMEATLARLEMNSLEIKLHLDSLEQRIGRMEPYLEGQSRGVPEAEPVRLTEAKEESPRAVAERAADAERSAPAEPVKGREAKEDRWSHLMGPDFDLPAAAPAVSGSSTSRVPFAGVAEAPGNGMRSAETGIRGFPPVADVSPVTVVDTPEARFARQPEARFGMQTSRPSVTEPEARLAIEREVWPASRPDVRSTMQPGTRFAGQPEATSELPSRAQPAVQPETWPPMPVPDDRMRLTEARFEGREPAGDLSEAGPARQLPERRDAPPAARMVVGEERGERRPAPRMFSTFEEPDNREEVLSGGPKMWRGYRVGRLVLAAVLLVLAVIPLAIWWRLSMDARDADAGDAAPASRVEPGAVALPSEKPSAGEVASTAVRRAPARSVGEAGSVHYGSAGVVAGQDSYASAGLAAGESRSLAASGGAAPVIRRAPSTAAGSYPPGRSSTSGRPVGGRTSGGVAAVGGTAIGLRGQPGGADEVQGTSGVRVRVPESVMAGRLLPTGDVGELPRGSGEVVAAVYISNTGRVEEVQVISGGRGMRDAATRAMRNWRYEPYVQGGVRVPVVTTASIRFDGRNGEVQ